VVDEQPYPRELDAILTDAVDRQLAEQRALREVLTELRDSVHALVARPDYGTVDLSGVEQRIAQVDEYIQSALHQLAAQPAQGPIDLSGVEERIAQTIHALEARGTVAPIDLSRLEERILEGVHSLASRAIPPPIDLPGLEERIRGIIEVNVHNADESIRSAVQGSILGATETTFASLSEQLRALREALVPRLEHAVAASDAVRAVWDEMGAVRQLVGGVSTDVEGIAQALIDFNSGLRQWADGLEKSITAIRRTVSDLQQVSFAPTDGDATGPQQTAGKDTASKKGRKGKAGKGRPEAQPEPGKGLEERIKETADLSSYLADQIQDLDGVMARLGDLPQQLEGTVSQALRRALTARAKLDREAETALDDVMASLDDHVNQLTGLLERFETEEDHIRKLALEQVELGSRIESLQESFLKRLETVEADRRHGEEAIAIAIDRSHRGLAPRALESLAKPAKRRTRASSAARKSKTQPTPTGTHKPLAAAMESVQKKKPKAKARPKAKAKRSARRTPTTVRDWTPIAKAETQNSDETLA
jgi:hypothetical protein